MAKPNGRCDQHMAELRHAPPARVGCIARSTRRLLMLVTGCTLAAVFGTAADSEPAAVEKLLSDAVRASSVGDFQTAWTSHRRAWGLAVASREAGDAMRSYCERHDCPGIHKTTWLLGKPSSELAFLAEHCRHTESDSCKTWFAGLHRFRAQVGSERRTPEQPAQDVAMRFPGLESGDIRPWTLAAVDGKRIWAILDTGSPHFIVGRDWANLQGLDYVVVSDPYTQRRWDGVEWSKRIIVLRDVELGSASEDRTLGVAYDGEGWNLMAVGMDMLLRYRSACFAWSDGTLHLGRLGPCKGGFTPYGARLGLRSTHPTILAPAPDGTTTPVLVDTGSRDNHCKRSLTARLEGQPLAFGDHPALQANCDTDGKWPAKHEDSQHDMTIGMETLSKFEAFGWELDPFRMYFVPPQAGSSWAPTPETQQEGTHEDLEERLAGAIRAIREGDFPRAWTTIRQAHWTGLSSQDMADAKNTFCARRECPDIYRIAWLAGRPGSDLDFLGGICKDIKVDACARWLAYHRRGGTHLGSARRPASNPPQDIPMWLDDQSGDARPRAEILVGGQPTPALLNTGASHSGFRRWWANREAVDYDVVGDPYTETRPDGTERRAREVVLRDLTLGGVTEPRVMAIARDDPDAEFELGIDVLLRYAAACFALADDRLHLGTPGPCAAGRTPLGAQLSPAGQPTVLVAGPDGAPVTVLIDTGTRENLCTSALAERLQGVPLRLGGYASVEARCDTNGDRLPDGGDAHDMVLGMEWLSRFEAFGWELAPFRLYFVPASVAS